MNLLPFSRTPLLVIHKYQTKHIISQAPQRTPSIPLNNYSGYENRVESVFLAFLAQSLQGFYGNLHYTGLRKMLVHRTYGETYFAVNAMGKKTGEKEKYCDAYLIFHSLKLLKKSIAPKIRA